MSRGRSSSRTRAVSALPTPRAKTSEWADRLIDGDVPIVGGGLLGRRDAELSFVHADDAADAFVATIEAGANGPYHVVDDEPVTGAVLLGRFPDLLDASDPGRIPTWLARFSVGTVDATGVASPTQTINERAKREFDWEPAYPTYREGMAQVVESRRADGTLADLRDDPVTGATDPVGEGATRTGAVGQCPGRGP